MIPKKLLILEDDTGLAESLKLELEERSYQCTLCTDSKKIPNESFDFAILDVRLKGGLGHEAIPKLKENNSNCKILMITGYGSIASAVEAIKLGACDYLTKPVLIEEILSIFEDSPLTNLSMGEKKPLSLSQKENEYIEYLLTKNNGNISKTAKDLGLHRQSLQRKLKKYT